MRQKQKIIIGSSIFLFILISETIYFKLTIHPKIFHQGIGIVIPVVTRKHVPYGTKITYNSNPPSSGAHYGEVDGVETAHAGIYTKPPEDGLLVHSLEHGAVILWYNPKKVSSEQVTQLTTLFRSIALKKILMTPRDMLDTPVALSSWGRIEKLPTIDAEKIKQFFYTNYDQGAEEADI